MVGANFAATNALESGFNQRFVWSITMSGVSGIVMAMMVLMVRRLVLRGCGSSDDGRARKPNKRRSEERSAATIDRLMRRSRMGLRAGIAHGDLRKAVLNIF